MSKLHFLESKAVDIDALRKTDERQELIAGMIWERSINIIYSMRGVGKSRLSMAISSHLCGMGFENIYLDVDNGVDIVKERGLDKHIEKLKPRLIYINADSFDDPKSGIAELLEELRSKAVGDFFKNICVVFDTLAFFLDGGIYDEGKINKIMSLAKAIRRAGGTVIILNHSTKNGETMKGGGSLADAVDTVFAVKNVGGHSESKTHLIVTPEKFRLKVRGTGWTIDHATLELAELDPVIASMSEAECEFCDRTRAELTKEPLSQGKLLSRAGKEAADRTALEWLNKHNGRFWQHTRKGKQKIYNKL